MQRTLSPNFEPKKLEELVRSNWNKVNVRKLVEERVKGRKRVGFVEGPPTMNGEPHIGHVRGRVMKDLWYRFMTLRGYHVIFRAGWDTQGLPVELQAEKELGLSGSKVENLAKIGEEKLVNTCKDIIMKYNKKWVECDKLLGMSLDYENAYWTYKDEYIEREWQYLKRAWDRGLLGEGYRVVAYCPSCQTSLSHAEVAQGYEEVEDPSVYFKVKLEHEDAYLIIWTTMPFTIITDELVAVKPDANYCLVKIKDEKWIVGKERLEALMKELEISDYKILSEFKGEALIGKKYLHPLEKYIKAQKELHSDPRVHIVVGEEFVDTTTGTGLVHLSPANGQEDFEAASKRGVPIFNPYNDEVKFTDGAGVFEGLFARDADEKVTKLLKKEGMLVKEDKILHEYPLCWRSKHKLIWLARREYFYWVDKIAELTLEAANKVEYYYEAPKNRFVEIIKEKVPWCISRERVWGAPLPIWVCKNCNSKIPLFSRKEIVKKAVELPDGENFELHRPWIDRITVRCEKCGGIAKREPFVLDTWHNSGAAPYSSLTNDEYNELVPAEFLTEGIDQTRGWAYTLLIENVILTGKAQAPYKAFLFQGHVLDEKGNKMSKSLGNIIDGIDVLSKEPVDILRFYLMWKSSPIDNLNFSYSEMRARPYQVLSTLYHLHVYLYQNSRYDRFSESKHSLDWAKKNGLLNVQEYWLLSKLQDLIDKTTKAYENCRYHEAARSLEDFIINIVSQGYVPLVRNEIWDDDPETLPRRLSIYSTLSYVLRTIDLLAHPIAPYITEFLYSNVFEHDKKEAILLESWPKVNEEFINKELEEEFEKIFQIVSLANSARSKAKLKRRWPLKKATILVSEGIAKRLSKHLNLINLLLNVKEGKVTANRDELPVKVKVQPNMATLGPKFKTKAKEVVNTILSINPLDLKKSIEREGKVKIKLDKEEYEVSKEDLQFYEEDKEGFSSTSEADITVSLEIERDKELMAEGIVRDLARRLQFLRKQRGYNPTEILSFAYVAGLDDEIVSMINKKKDQLAYLVRVKEAKVMKKEIKGVKWEKAELDGKEISISVE
jgi:isoleucyl-tRNA synthetase